MTSGNGPIVIAHRGASGYRPEHTRAAFALALELGADAVEPDLVASGDGVLVIRHENEISATTDVAGRREFAGRRTAKTIDGVRRTGWFTEDFTWAELSSLRATERLPRVRPMNTQYDGREGILRLEDLLSLLDDEHARRIALVAELKHATYFASIGLPLDPLFADALERAGWQDDAHSERLTVESFERSVLGALRTRGVRGRRVYLVDAEGAPADAPAEPYASSLEPQALAELADSVHGIAVDKQLVLAADGGRASSGPALVSHAHAAGLYVYCWTLRAENRFLAPRYRTRGAPSHYGDWSAEFGEVLRSGVDGVFADQPDLAIEARDRFTAR